jgi:hypothetical protein
VIKRYVYQIVISINPDDSDDVEMLEQFKKAANVVGGLELLDVETFNE